MPSERFDDPDPAGRDIHAHASAIRRSGLDRHGFERRRLAVKRAGS
jgi:hypothetical protein